MQTTLEHIQAKLDELNIESGYEIDYVSGGGELGKLTWNIGTYYLSKNDVGYQIEQIASKNGGAIDISFRGTKKEIYHCLKVVNEVLYQNKRNKKGGK